jgi:glutamate N-acetyltransferase / amino-acid N-acetyltransferase
MTDSFPLAGSIQLPAGFSFSSIAAGIKASGRLDLALVDCSPETTAAAVFTTNRIAAAPVQVGRASLRSSRGGVRAVLVNAGNANCATGPHGLAVCRQVCQETARALGVSPDQVFPSSTGIIGVPLPGDKILAKLPHLIAQRAASAQAVAGFAQSIMTTDMRAKLACTAIQTGGGTIKTLGIAKGSGMIHPKLATMLVFLFTDIAAPAATLRRALVGVCDQTFNCISVDGDTSTNDTALLLASGRSGIRLNQAVNKSFRAGLLKVCHSLAHQIVSDGEGVQHVIELTVEQSRTREEALRIARAIAHSPLVKTAWAGADPNWGRILAAIGNSGVPVNTSAINIYIGEQQVCRGGCMSSFNEKAAHEHLTQRECKVRVQVGRGRTMLRFYTTDLSAEYVRINAEYST